MTSGIVHPSLNASHSVPPHFDHALRPRLMVGIIALLTLLLLAFFVYGQMAPGA